MSPTHPGGATRLAVAGSLAVVALRNLVDNALQYAPAETAVRVTIETNAHTVGFVVIDQGPGLDQAAAATRRFWRAGAAHGSGLGLTIVDAIARRYDGRLLLSNRNPGLEARLELPRA